MIYLRIIKLMIVTRNNKDDDTQTPVVSGSIPTTIGRHNIATDVINI